jgi:HopA1 effector protein family
MLQPDTITEIRKILDVVEVESPATFTFAGRRFRIPGDPTAKETATVIALTQEIYQNGFCQRVEDAGKQHFPAGDQADDFSAELLSANKAKARWSNGWTIASIDNVGRILAQRNGALRLFWPGEYLVEDLAGNLPQVSALARVHVAVESLTAQPGFYFAFGESLDNRRDRLDIVRFYWSVSAAAAVRLVEALTQKLNRFCIPYRFKCLTKPSQYWRLDPAVLYVERRYFRITAELSSEIYIRLQRDMRTASPLFTKVLAPGLGLAEDPPNMTSFGLHRSGLLAKALFEGQDSNATRAQLSSIIERQFEREGLSLMRPYLNAGSIDDYEFAIA